MADGAGAAPGAYSAERAWDEEARPHARLAPRARYTAVGTQVWQHLVDTHDGLRSELLQLRELLDEMRVGASDVAADPTKLDRLTVRQNTWALGAHCQHYCLAVATHTAAEDSSVLPHLRDAEPTLAPVLDRLAAEHEAIDDVLGRIDAALVRLAREPAELDDLQDAIDLLTDAMLSHLVYEEAELIEALARHGFYPGQVEPYDPQAAVPPGPSRR